MAETICEKCGGTLWDAANRGAYFRRLNKGELPSQWECCPDCDGQHGGPDEAVVRAVRGSADD